MASRPQGGVGWGAAASSFQNVVQAISGTVGAVDELMLQLKSSTAEQSSGIDEVNGSLSRVDAITQGNAALVEDSAATAEVLRGQAADLVAVVSVFTL